MTVSSHRSLTVVVAWLLAASATWAQTRGVRGFDTAPDKRLPGFGRHAELRSRVTQEDHARALASLKRADRNRNGTLERTELANWSDADFANWDINSDGRIDRTEKAIEEAAGARRKATAEKREQVTWNMRGVDVTAADRKSAISTVQKYDRDRNGVLDTSEIPSSWKYAGLKDTDLDRDGRISREEMMRYVAMDRIDQQDRAARREAADLGTRARMDECRSLAAMIIGRFDRNRNKVLDGRELTGEARQYAGADLNRNGYVISTELGDWLLSRLMSQPGGRLPAGVPDWFVARDENLDGQLLLSEYMNHVGARDRTEFARYDRNGDGIITAAESVSAAGGAERYANEGEVIIEPYVGVSSEILIQADYIVGDIDLQFCVTHSEPEDMDAYLIAPDGQRVQLFAGEGRKWSGSDFEDTILDDEATRILAAERPPFRGSFQPDGVAADQGLGAFDGKSVRGVWRLVLRAERTSRPGLLHGWSLSIQPATDEKNPAAPDQEAGEMP